MQIDRKIAFLIATILGLLVIKAAAQDFEGAIVKYQRTARYDFFEVFKGENSSPEVDDWIASIPNTSMTSKILYLTSEEALYTQDPEDKSKVPNRLNEALFKAEYVQGPRKDLIEVYSDFKKNETMETIQFMTRMFRIAGPIEPQPWKMTHETVLIHDFPCMSAEMEHGDDRYTAWFTSRIPVPAGPANYGGLPGLILAVEKNEETIFYAQSVELAVPDADLLKKPDKGKEIFRDEFDKIVAEKMDEWLRQQEGGGEKKDD